MHGFQLMLGETAAEALWLATLLAMGGFSFFLLLSLAFSHLTDSWRTLLITIAVIKLAIYIGLTSISREFLLVIGDYGVAMLVALGFHGASQLRGKRPGSAAISLGILLTFVSSGVQISGFSLHQYFNNNDIFHVLQMGATYLFYRGALALTDRSAKSA
ncbi:hypothetical protein MAIT1_03678 [Magnetofaba australis IT-1]|uniref:Uncharacterized protein n=2 Tax=Magnetofaba TaxID=1472292 RepID=A0A1Y2K3T8_9PROT|nr:hypothetical protein MAIT1_03678 [Magnetofaba australis IT-1]